jgi:hypothetical protein
MTNKNRKSVPFADGPSYNRQRRYALKAPPGKGFAALRQIAKEKDHGG